MPVASKATWYSHLICWIPYDHMGDYFRLSMPNFPRSSSWCLQEVVTKLCNRGRQMVCEGELSVLLVTIVSVNSTKKYQRVPSLKKTVNIILQYVRFTFFCNDLANMFRDGKWNAEEKRAYDMNKTHKSSTVCFTIWLKISIMSRTPKVRITFICMTPVQLVHIMKTSRRKRTEIFKTVLRPSIRKYDIM